MQVRHVGVVVEDLGGAIRFWKLLGFQLSHQAEEIGDYLDTVLGLVKVHITTVKMYDDAGQVVELLKFRTHDTEGGPYPIFRRGFSHVAITVVNLDAEYQRLVSFGVRFISEPRLNEYGTAKLAFCVDKESNFVEIVQDIIPLRAA